MQLKQLKSVVKVTTKTNLKQVLITHDPMISKPRKLCPKSWYTVFLLRKFVYTASLALKMKYQDGSFVNGLHEKTKKIIMKKSICKVNTLFT